MPKRSNVFAQKPGPRRRIRTTARCTALARVLDRVRGATQVEAVARRASTRKPRSVAQYPEGNTLDCRRTPAAVHGDISEGGVEPAITPSSEARSWLPEEALVELVRGRLEGLGPCTQEALTGSLGLKDPKLPPHSLRSRRKAVMAPRRARRSKSGASADCSRASTATR